MSFTTNQFHRHHARAAERCWEARHYVATFGHGLAALGVAPWRGMRRFWAGGIQRFIWRIALRLLTTPAP